MTDLRPGPTAAPAQRGVSLSTAASYVAVGTGVSRLTGVLRIVALAWALGQSHLADAFNLANTTPNMLYDIVLGRGAVGHVHPGLRRSAGQPDQG